MLWQQVNWYLGTQNDKPTMCEVTWNTWESVSVVCFLLLSASPDCSSLFRWYHTLWLKFGSALTHPIHVSCFMRIVVVCPSDLFDISIYFSFLTVFSLITLSFLLPVNFIFHDVVDETLRTSAEDLGTLAENEPPTGRRRSVQLWRWQWVIIKSVAESRSWSDSYLVMEPDHG